MGDDLKGAGEFGSIWTRMPIEDHHDFPPDEGSILVPFRDFPENWASAPDMASLQFLDRDFIFPGEQFHVLVHVRTPDKTSVTEGVTPFQVAAAMNKREAENTEGTSHDTANGGGEEGGGEVSDDAEIVEGGALEVRDTDGDQNGGEAVRGTLTGHSEKFAASPTTLLQQEANTKRSQLLLESFRKSHYYVSISPADEPSFQKRVIGGTEPSSAGNEDAGSEELSARNHGCTPALIEGGRFDPSSAGGVARHAVACSLLSNGDIVVLLQVTMAAESIFDDALIEVLQFERYEPPAFGPIHDSFGPSLLRRDTLDHTPGLLQWLLPLDRPASPPPNLVGSLHASPPKVALTSTNSNIFSFGHLRSASSGSIPAVQPSAPPLPQPGYAPQVYGSKEWDASLQERNTKAEVGSEGLLSFRGAVLEPQRFSAHYGLEGPHVPGKRWRRKLSIIQPIKLESYHAHCNAQDLICILVENVLPPTGRTAEVVIYVDSVNIMCQSVAPGSPPIAVPVACVEVGADQQLPGLPLRVGEQHSFILRPTSPAWKPPPLDDTKQNSTGFRSGHELQSPVESASSRKRLFKDPSSSSPAGDHYAVIVSCHCSHTESRLHYKHSLQWRPRVPRDLLVSVSLETAPPLDSAEIQPVFKSQVVTVQATNLTSKDMNLTLHAPSSLANSPLSMISFPAPHADSPVTLQYNQQLSMDLNEEVANENEEESEDPTDQLPNSSGSPSLPPVQSMESVIGVSPILLRERNISTADMVADNSPARTHLWLQSTVPLGCVPAHSTTAVKCDILPLTDGIITLDTLHISSNDSDALYIPESPLQIHTTSSLASGVA